jgi:hypothetical protein
MSAPGGWGYQGGSFGGGVAAVLVAVIAGCGPSDDSATPYVPFDNEAGWSASTVDGSPQPMVVLVDADRTLTATPGQGVGVFAEYRSGGHWHIWWTCDSAVNASAAPCDFQVTASVTTGTLLLAQDAAAGQQIGAQAVSLSTITTTNVDGFDADATPGQAIELDAQLNGGRDGRFLFFVQDGVVNGGYTGMLTDPLVLMPASP